MPRTTLAHGFIAISSFTLAAVAAWWAVAVQHMPPGSLTVDFLAALGAFDLAACALRAAHNLRHTRRH